MQKIDKWERMEEDKRLKECMSRIRHKLIVTSGKGGVGKSRVAVNLAYGLAVIGYYEANTRNNYKGLDG